MQNGISTTEKLFNTFIDRGKWFHIAVIFYANGSSQPYGNMSDLYINAVNVTNGTTKLQSQFVWPNTGGFFIGSRADGAATMNAHIDDVMVFDYAVSPEAIKAIYENGTRFKTGTFSSNITATANTANFSVSQTQNTTFGTNVSYPFDSNFGTLNYIFVS